MKVTRIFRSLSIILILGPGCSRVKFPYKPSSDEYIRLRQSLETVYKQDQAVRSVDMSSSMGDSLAMQAYYHRMKRTDSTNQTIVLSILDRYGWLPQSQVGDTAAWALYYVIQHSNARIIQRYLPQMEQQAHKGEASNTSAATMRDRLLMFQGKKQRYGTQAANWVRSDGTNVVWPIRRPATVNARRTKIGFRTSVEQDAEQLRAIYNPAEKLPSGPSPFRAK